MPVAANATTFPTWNYTVTDTSPVWAYVRLVFTPALPFIDLSFKLHSADKRPLKAIVAKAWSCK